MQTRALLRVETLARLTQILATGHPVAMALVVGLALCGVVAVLILAAIRILACRILGVRLTVGFRGSVAGRAVLISILALGVRTRLRRLLLAFAVRCLSAFGSAFCSAFCCVFSCC